ncbi:cell wall metabolism sensor histidine kinase WalK [Cohnella sp. AR92]|uniref:sensor histidine kinase n=1 Tax=Cohnella sp. AR92 TaxID=648716 RepID=UPI000F8CE7F9|nr:HAMP domain-containing sensor histidine kinase [Cohnella sp. AR92]RUS45541.1 HAMP domain-containing histidine kinase [Cohnella sp. AR92]
MSIRLRLTLWYSGLLAVTLVAFSLFVYYIVAHNAFSELKSKLSQEARGIKADSIGSQLIIQTSNRFDRYSIYAQLISYRNNADGIVSDGTTNLLGWEFSHPPLDAVNFDYRYIQRSIGDEPIYVLEIPVAQISTGKIVGLMQIATLMNKEVDMLAKLRQILVMTSFAGLVVAFLLGMFLSRKALRPIEQVTEAAERIQSGSDLSTRIPGDSEDEIGRLRQTLNHMLERIEGAYRGLEETNIAQRRFVSDASHELRTPLTTIRGNVDFLEKIWQSPVIASTNEPSEPSGPREEENIRMASSPRLTAEEKEQLSKEAIKDIADESRRMSRLVNDMLSLARADAGYVMEKERIELKPLAEEAARRAVFLPRQAEWKVGSLDALNGVWVQGNRDYLVQLLFIFIENGFKYTPAGEVRLEALRKDDKVALVIADTGIGISREEVPHIFDRFYRVDVSRGQTPGTGLGLSIAKWIADMHHATLEVRTKVGEGTKFIVWLPVDFSEPVEYDIIEPSARPTESE